MMKFKRWKKMIVMLLIATMFLQSVVVYADDGTSTMPSQTITSSDARTAADDKPTTSQTPPGGSDVEDLDDPGGSGDVEDPDDSDGSGDADNPADPDGKGDGEGSKETTGLVNGDGNSIDADGETEEEQETEPVNEEVPEEVKAFLEAVAKLPASEDVTKENAKEIGEQVNTAIDLYEGLVDLGLDEREDVAEAIETVYAIYAAIDTVLEMESDNYGTFLANQINPGTVTKYVGEAGFYQRLPRLTIVHQYCGNVAIEYVPDSWAYSDTVEYDDTIVKDLTAFIGGYRGNEYGNGYNGIDCYELTYTAKTPGRTPINIKLDYYYDAPAETGYCDWCGGRIQYDGDYNDYYDLISFTVKVVTDYTVTYKGEGVTTNTQKVGNAIASVSHSFTAASAPTREGYTFQGWQYSGNGQIYKAGATVPMTWETSDGCNVIETMTAVWEKDAKTYTVTYTDGVQGEIVFPDQGYEGLKEGDATPKFQGTPTRKGYNFMGWSPTVNSVVSGADADDNNEIIYTATWQKIEEKTYTVTYTDGVQGEIVFPDQGYEGLKEGDTTPKFQGTPERDGYTFKGWSPAVKEKVSGADADEEGNIIYTATWKEITTTLGVEKVAQDDNGDPVENPKAGETVKYVITVTNNGKVTAKNVTVTDALDSNLEYVGASLKVDGQNRNVSKTGNNYSIGDIPAGKSAVLIIETKVKSDVAVDTLIKNTASANHTNKPEGTPPSGEAEITVGGERLTVTKTKTSTDSVVEVGDTITWKITVKNNTATEMTVKVNDILANASGNAIVKDEAGNEIDPDTGVKVAAKRIIELTASYTVLPSDAGKTIKNSVKVTDSSNPDDPVEETEDGEGTKVNDKTTLDIMKAYQDRDGKAGNPKAGETVKYVITVTNNGKVTAENVTVTDVLDGNLEYMGASLTVDRQNRNVSKTGNNYSIGDIPAEKSAVLTVEATVKSDVAVETLIENTASVDHTNKPEGTATPSDEADFTVGGSPLDVSKVRTSGSVAIVGDENTGTITWTITLTNNTAKNKTVTVKDILKDAAGSAIVKDASGESITGEITVPARSSVTLTASYEVKEEDGGKKLINSVKVTDQDDPNETVEDEDEGTDVKLQRKVIIQYVDDSNPERILKEEEKLKDGSVPFTDGDTYDLKVWGLKKDDGNDIEEIDIEDHHYIVVSIDDSGNERVDGEDVVIKVTCTLDDIGPDDEPDGIPDKYQVVVTYRAVNGTINGPAKAVVTLTDEAGDYATVEDGGKGNLTAEQIPGTSANEGYGNGTWAPATPTVTYEITEDTEFVITYSQNETTPPVPEITPLIPESVPTVGPTPVVPTVTPVPATPAAPTPTAALVSPTPEAVELADEAVPLAAEEEREQPEPVAVDEEETPLAGGKGAAWALINFALMNLAIFESIMLLIGYFVKTKNDEEEEKRKLKKKGIFRIISLPIAVISLIVFILTEDITLPTAFVDKYTIVMLIIAIVQTVMVALSNKKYEDEDEQEV